MFQKIKIKNFSSTLGTLLPLESKDCPFPPERVFFVYNVPQGIRRGNHAHKKTKLFFVCLTGTIKIGLHDGKHLQHINLYQGGALLVNEMVWNYQDYLTGQDILAVMCSTAYDSNDYVNDFETFISLKNKPL